MRHSEVDSFGVVRDIEGTAAEVRSAALDLQAHLASARFSRAAREFKYSVDQLRVPAGTWEGGRWAVAGGVTATLLGWRVGVSEGGMIRHCTYIDADGNMTTLVLDATDLCPPTIKVRKRYL